MKSKWAVEMDNVDRFSFEKRQRSPWYRVVGRPGYKHGFGVEQGAHSLFGVGQAAFVSA